MTQQPRNSPELASTAADKVQKVVGPHLYYMRAVDPIMMVTLNIITSKQSKYITQETAKNVVQLLRYAYTHPEVIAKFHSSGMVLHMHSDAYFF